MYPEPPVASDQPAFLWPVCVSRARSLQTLLCVFRGPALSECLFRPRHGGNQRGVDKDLANSAWKDVTRLRGYMAGTVRGIIAGSITVCGTVRKLFKFTEPDKCADCDMDCVDDHLHMWWTCPGHVDVRAEYPELMRADRSAGPPCMLHNGIAPLGWERAQLKPPIFEESGCSLVNYRIRIKSFFTLRTRFIHGPCPHHKVFFCGRYMRTRGYNAGL